MDHYFTCAAIINKWDARTWQSNLFQPWFIPVIGNERKRNWLWRKRINNASWCDGRNFHNDFRFRNCRVLLPNLNVTFWGRKNDDKCLLFVTRAYVESYLDGWWMNSIEIYVIGVWRVHGVDFRNWFGTRDCARRGFPFVYATGKLKKSIDRKMEFSTWNFRHFAFYRTLW